MFTMNTIFNLLFILSVFHSSTALWCYQCTSAIPGCTTPFNWRGMGWLGSPCPETDDICIKLIERKGSEEVITRDCLSNFKTFRTDIPADTYEGCRAAAKDLNLANYVNNTIKELDVKRDHFDQTTWCFCFLDHRCNNSNMLSTPIIFIISVLSLHFFLKNLC